MTAEQRQLLLAQRRGPQTILNLAELRLHDATILADFEDTWEHLWELIVLEPGESTPIQIHPLRYHRAWIWPVEGQLRRVHYQGPSSELQQGTNWQYTEPEVCTLLGVNQTEPTQPEIEVNPSTWHQYQNASTESRAIALLQYTAVPLS